MNRWKVKKHPAGGYAIYHGETWHDLCPTHTEAMTWAHRYAITEAIDGGAPQRWGNTVRWVKGHFQTS